MASASASIFQPEILYKNTKTFTQINLYSPNKVHCYGTYDKKYIDVSYISALRDIYFNILNTDENKHKSVICVGNYFTHQYSKMCVICGNNCSGYTHGTHMFDSKCVNKTCVEHNTCFGYHKINNNKIVPNLQNTKCLGCCKCRCVCNKKHCRYNIDLMKCGCVCDENCKNIEIQPFISETNKINENILDTVSRGIIEEINMSIKESINILDYKEKRLSAYIEVKDDTVVEYKKIVFNEKHDNKLCKVNIIIFGEHNILKNKIKNIFKKNNFVPNDDIGCLLILPIHKIEALFPYAFSQYHINDLQLQNINIEKKIDNINIVLNEPTLEDIFILKNDIEEDKEQIYELNNCKEDKQVYELLLDDNKPKKKNICDKFLKLFKT